MSTITDSVALETKQNLQKIQQVIADLPKDECSKDLQPESPFAFLISVKQNKIPMSWPTFDARKI